MNDDVKGADEGVDALLRAGRLREARAAIEAAIDAGDDSAQNRDMAGMLAGRIGDPAAAARHFRALLAMRPYDRVARLNLATALLQTQDYSDVEAVCAPLASDGRAARLRAFAAQQRGDNALAATLYDAIVAVTPADADSWNNLGNARAALGDVDAAVAAFEEAITLRRADPRIYLNLAQVLDRADRRDPRVRTMREAARVAPRDPEVQLALGLAESAAGNTDAAETALRAAIALAPDDPAAYLELGLLLETRNRIDALGQLIAHAGQRLGAEGSLLKAWAAFRAKRFDEAQAFAEAAPETINAMRRSHLLGQIADRRGDAAQAFAHFAAMNAAAIESSPPPVEPVTYRAKVDAETAGLRAIGPAGWPDGPIVAAPPSPIFIVGFPRSGTTLLDTMLGAAPGVHVLEEQPLILSVLGRMAPEETAASLGDARVRELRAHYFEALDTLSPTKAGDRIVDKHPLHMARMAIVNRLFPDAAVILVERHPCDVVLSCFMANFQMNHAMRSFTSLEEAARTYDAVFNAWEVAEAVLPMRVHRVRYERLVVDPESEMRRLLKFADLPWCSDVLDNQTAAASRGHIRTASYSQVTEPVHARSAGRWERYRAALEPVLPILASWATKMGYACETR